MELFASYPPCLRSPRSFVGALAQHGWAKFDIWLVSAASLGASERVLKFDACADGARVGKSGVRSREFLMDAPAIKI